MRPHPVLLVCAVLLTGCTTGQSEEVPGASTQPASPAPVSTAAAAAPSPTTGPPEPSVEDLCGTLSQGDLVSLLGESPRGTPDLLDGIDSCRWQAADGRFVQVLQTDATTWVKALPEAVEAYRAGGLATGDDLAKIEDTAEVIAGGGSVSADQACSLFADLLEITDGRPGMTEVIRVVPDPERPLSLSGQRCSDGVFSSITLASAEGPLTAPLPAEEIRGLLARVHESGTP